MVMFFYLSIKILFFQLEEIERIMECIEAIGVFVALKYTLTLFGKFVGQCPSFADQGMLHFVLL